MILEPILGYKSTWRILSILAETPRKPISRQELLQHTKLGNAPLSQALIRLTKSNLIIKEKKEKKERYYINSNSEYTKIIMQLLAQEKTDLRFLDYEIKNILADFLKQTINQEITQIILFGSWAKGNANTNSDIDLAIISKKNLNLLEITNITKNIEKKSGKEIQIHQFTEKNFEKENTLIKEIKKTGINII